MTNFSTFQWKLHLIWSSNHKEMWIFVKQVTGPFVPSFAIRMYMAFADQSCQPLEAQISTQHLKN